MKSCAALLVAAALGGCYRSHTPVEERDAAPPHDAGHPSIDAGPPPPDLCISVAPPRSPEPIPIEFVARIREADLALLVDSTGSMVQEVQRLRESFREEILPGLSAAVPELRLSVAQVTDFEGEAMTNSLFRLHAPTSSDPDVVQEGLDAIWREHGGDGPEAQVVALWLTATGEGYDRGLTLPVPPADCPPPAMGYPCFPADGARLVVLFTDATFHNGPGDAYPYEERFGAPTYEVTLAALRSIGARVVGVYSGAPGAEGESHLQAVARDTRAVDARGRPIVQSVGRGGETLPQGAVEVVRTFVEEAPLDLDLLLEDVAGDARDATELVLRVEAAGAEPPDGAIEDGERFADVRPGTTVRFRLLIREDAFGPADVGRSYRLAATLRSDGVVRLERRVIEIVIEGGDARCPSS